MADDMEHEGDKSKHVRVNNEVTYKELEPRTSNGSHSSSSSSSSGSSAITDDRLDVSESRDLKSSSLKANQQSELSLGRGISISSPNVSPPVQVMGKSSDYDPNRIPAFVFNKPSTAQVEWSVASTESLFSIHMGGNSSFSRDLPILLAKSQELTKSGDVTKLLTRMATVTEVADTEMLTVRTRKASDGEDAPIEESAKEAQRNQNGPSTHKCSDKSVHCVDSDGLAGEGLKTYLEKVELDDSEESTSQPQTPEPVSNNTIVASTWYSCFCCFSCHGG